MKLRNKKTGEIVDVSSFDTREFSLGICYFSDKYEERIAYNSLADLNEDWEDYTPQEPLIKDDDKKRRKLLRDWANVNEILGVKYHNLRGGGGSYFEFEGGEFTQGYAIMFADIFEGLEDSKYYTIPELCGEEDNEN